MQHVTTFYVLAGDGEWRWSHAWMFASSRDSWTDWLWCTRDACDERANVLSDTWDGGLISGLRLRRNISQLTFFHTSHSDRRNIHPQDIAQCPTWRIFVLFPCGPSPKNCFPRAWTGHLRNMKMKEKRKLLVWGNITANKSYQVIKEWMCERKYVWWWCNTRRSGTQHHH